MRLRSLCAMLMTTGGDRPVLSPPSTPSPCAASSGRAPSPLTRPSPPRRISLGLRRALWLPRTRGRICNVGLATEDCSRHLHHRGASVAWSRARRRYYHPGRLVSELLGCMAPRRLRFLHPVDVDPSYLQRCSCSSCLLSTLLNWHFVLR